MEHKHECIVLAPTGIAAVNIGGVTIHRFFHFPTVPLAFSGIKYLNWEDENDAAKRLVIECAKYLIIDEISMVRADIMDQVEWFFKKNWPNKEPFAGLKIIMVGDLDQLPPVLVDPEEKKMIYARYKSEFFFHAKCWENNKFQTIALTHVFRQSDPIFVNLLNDIKNNRLAPFDLDRLNNTCYRDQEKFTPNDGIMLCSTNKTANQVNSVMIDRLEGDLIRLEGKIKGSFNPKNCPVEPIIDLKIGCRVMTMRNDPENRFQNGSIGTLGGRADNGDLLINMDNGEDIALSPFTFESIDYAFDEKTDRIKHAVTGWFIQYPIKVAYALTIHKSQGQTFDKVIVDLGEGGAFAHGQVYVALSRCTSMEGLILRRRINQKDLIYNRNVLDFHKI
jgi:hypothetical protein